jgi:quinone-modifying oxidoreductase subunit QmoA
MEMLCQQPLEQRNQDLGDRQKGYHQFIVMESADVLILGGGISGITAAVELAETGLGVILAEKLPYLGGRVIRMNRYFPKLCPPYCGLEINFQRIRRNGNIRILTETSITSVSGQPGSYQVTLRKAPEYINERCTSCGACEKVCPVEGPDDFNYGLASRKGIALPHELAFPFRYHLDSRICEPGQCHACMDACTYGAIDLQAAETSISVAVGAIIYATGWRPYEAGNLDEYPSGLSADIITNVMMERLAAPNGPTGGKILRPSDKSPVKKAAFIQCAGSRDTRHQSWCSAVCCTASLKQALYITDQDPEARVSIFYIDLRVSGRNEDFLRKVEDNPQISLVKGKVAEVNISGSTGKPVVKAEDIMHGQLVTEEYDLVVLATGMAPEPPVPGYLSTRDPGMIIAGCAGSPMDVSSSLRDATGAALKALQICKRVSIPAGGHENG